MVAAIYLGQVWILLSPTASFPDRGGCRGESLLDLIGRFRAEGMPTTKVALRKIVSVFLFSSGMKVHCNALWFSDKQILQYAAFSIVTRAFRLAIREDNASEDTGDN